jgi:hypothetical protein
MAKMRRVIIIEGMFKDICTPEEMEIVDRMYKMGQKGGAVVFMLKRIRSKWVEMINSGYKSQGDFNLPKLTL